MLLEGEIEDRPLQLDLVVLLLTCLATSYYNLAAPLVCLDLPVWQGLLRAKGGCKKGAKCHFTHVCSLCFGQRPRHQCTAAASKAANTQGAANA